MLIYEPGYIICKSGAGPDCPLDDFSGKRGLWMETVLVIGPEKWDSPKTTWPDLTEIQVWFPELVSWPIQTSISFLEWRQIEWTGARHFPFNSWMIGFSGQNDKTKHFYCWLKSNSLISDQYLLHQFWLGNHAIFFKCCIRSPIVMENPPNMEM